MKRLIGLLLVVGLALPPAAWAAPAAVTPESTSEARFAVEENGQRLASTGELQAASDLYWAKGFELRDPVLIIAAAEALRDLANRDRSTSAAQAGLDRLSVAFDMLYYLRDSATSSQWQPLTGEQVSMVLGRAERVSDELQTLVRTIQAEVDAAAAAPEPTDEDKRGPAKPGTWMIVGGTALLVVGLGVGGGLGGAGLSIGAAAQREVEDPLVYAQEHRAAEARGKQGNTLAGVGFAIAGVGVVAGAVLIAVGLKKRKASTSTSSQAMVPVPLWLAGGAGVGLAGRF